MKKSVKKPMDVFRAAKTTGDLIEAFRSNFDIKQDDMANACKISQAKVSAIEKNRREVGPRVALKLAAFLGLSPDVILYPNGYEAEPDDKEVRERYTHFTPVLAKVRSS